MQPLLSLNFLVPFVAAKVDFSKSIRGLRGMPRRLLLIGHKSDVGTPTIVTLDEAPWAEIVPSTTAPGTLTANTVHTISSETDAVALLGEGSMLLSMWRAAKANADLGLPIDVIAVPAAEAAAPATSTIVVNLTGATVSANGTVQLYIGGTRIEVGVTTADTEATVATKLIAAINSVAALPVVATGTEDEEEVKLTCRWVGLTGNLIDLRVAYYADDVMPAGLTLTVPAMAGGTTSPSLDAAIANMADGRWTEIVLPFTDNGSMLDIEAELAKRFKEDNMQDGQAVTVVRGDQAQVTAWLSGRNSEQVHTIVVTKDLTNPWETAAMAGAAIESSAALDPTVPYTDIPLVGYLGPKRGDHWNLNQTNDLLLEGGSPLQVLPDRSGTLLRVVTNYTKNVVGAADSRRRELCWIKSASYKRWFDVTEFQLNYRGFKGAEYITEPIPGQKIMTAELGEEVMIGNYQALINAGICQNMDHYKSTLRVEFDGQLGRLQIYDEPVFVTQHYQTEITSAFIAGHV